MVVLYGKQFQVKLLKEKKKHSKGRTMLKEATESNLNTVQKLKWSLLYRVLIK